MTARGQTALQTVLTVIVVVGLAVDAYVHFSLASAFENVKTSTLSQADLFRVEGVLAVLAAIALVVRPRRYTAAFAFLVAAGGTVAVVLYRYVDVGSIGPIPNMYDPFWQPARKTLSLVAETLAALGAAGLFVMFHIQARSAAAERPVQVSS